MFQRFHLFLASLVMSRKNIRLKWFGRGNIDDIETHVLILFAVINSYPFLSWTSLLSRTSLLCFVVRNHFFCSSELLYFPYNNKPYFFAVLKSFPLLLLPLILVIAIHYFFYNIIHCYHDFLSIDIMNYNMKLKLRLQCPVV